MTVIDVTEATFASEVVERSATTPVVVDFWASWCGPCRALGPLLESAAAAREGQVILAKIDTDANPRLSQSFGIQGIPAVKAFRDRDVVAEFVGAQPRSAVERFFDGLVPSEAEQLVGAGDEASLRRALELEPTRADAAIPLARLLIARDDADGALAALGSVVGSFQADGLRARLRLAAADQATAAIDALDAGRDEDAFELLLTALPDDDIRQLLVGELDRRGPGDPLTQTTRRRLAAALF